MIKRVLALGLLLSAMAFVIAFAIGCGCLVGEEQAVRAVTNLGFTDVKVESKSVTLVEWHGCSKSDDAAFKVSGKNPQGRRVTLTVCVGWPFKGATVRSM